MISVLVRARESRLLQLAPVVRARHWLHRQRAIHDSLAVRQLRQLVGRLRTDPPDILYLGDSVLPWVDPDDEDQRTVVQLLKGSLGPEVSMFSIWGGSYGPGLHLAYLRALEVTDHRPLIINTLWARGCTPGWTEHPVWGHKRSIAAMHALDLRGPLRQLRFKMPEPAPHEWDAFYRLPYPTLDHPDAVVGDFAPKLRDLDRWAEDDPERVKMLYEYHHGASVSGTRGLAAYTELGARVRELGCVAVAYEDPIPVDTCERLLGSAYVALADENLAQLRRAYHAGVGDDVEIVRSGTVMREDEFIGLLDASEHLSEGGRHHLVELITPAIQRALERRG